MSAPANIARTEATLRPRGIGGHPRIGGYSGQGHGQYRRRQIRYRQMPGRCILDSHGQRQEGGHRGDSGQRSREVGRGGDPQCRRDEHELNERGHGQESGSPQVPADQPPTGGRPHQEPPKGDERGHQREPRRAGGGKTYEHHVSRHVGDEHAPESQDAYRVDQPGHHREHEEQNGQMPMVRVLHQRAQEPSARRLVGRHSKDGTAQTRRKRP